MATTTSTTALQELLTAISDARIRQSVRVLAETSIAAVTAMSRLDENIFALRKEASAARLRHVADETFVPLRQLVRAIETLDRATGAGETLDESAEAELDFDFDTSAPSPPEQDKTGLTLDASDIEDAFEMFGSGASRSCEERWSALRIELDSLAYALGSQLRDFDQRFLDALEQQRFPHALRELDDGTSSLIDGVFALMTSIYQAFLHEIDPNRFIPGHRDTLSRALEIRKGLTDLRRTIAAQNALVQDAEASAEAQEQALLCAAQKLDAFVASDVFGLMRSQDRGELESFQQQLAQPARTQARLSCEGLDKYLDSLASVSQRDVLIKHDASVKEDIAEILEAVAPLLHISPHGAADMVAQAFASAESLFGLHDELDALVAEWTSRPQDAHAPAQAAQMGQRLQAILTPSHS